jgi:mono/diheme cytochrome c family protein
MKRFFVALVFVTAAGCGSARRSAPLIGPPALTTDRLREGEVLFQEFCHQCHPGGEAGLGPALNDKPLPTPAIKVQVRAGVGAMPSIPEAMLSSDHLDKIVDYIVAIRRQR